MRVIVCGGRDYDAYEDRGCLYSTLDKYIRTGDTDSLVIQGGARGADRLAREWADDRGIPHIEVPALWTWHKGSAGPIRNRYMLHVGQLLHVEMVIAFPGGRGTDHMKRIARDANVAVLEIPECKPSTTADIVAT